LEQNIGKSESVSDGILTGFVESLINKLSTNNIWLNNTINLMGNKMQKFAKEYLEFTRYLYCNQS
jgi:hypothetical protein